MSCTITGRHKYNIGAYKGKSVPLHLYLYSVKNSSKISTLLIFTLDSADLSITIKIECNIHSIKINKQVIALVRYFARFKNM